MKPDSTPHQYSPRQKKTKASTHRIAPTAVTKFGLRPGLRRPAGQIKGRPAPQIERQDIGDALVGRVIGGALDRLGIVRIERHDERAVALAQLGIAELGGFRGQRLIALDRGAVGHGLQRSLRRPRRREHAPAPACRPRSGRCAGGPPSPSAMPGPTHNRGSRPALARPGSRRIGAFEARIGRQPARARPRVHSEQPRRIGPDGHKQGADSLVIAPRIKGRTGQESGQAASDLPDCR